MFTRLRTTSGYPKKRFTFLLCTTTLFAISCTQEREAQQSVQATAPSDQQTIVSEDTLAKATPDTTAIVAQATTDTSWIYPGPKPLPGAILPEKRILAFYGNPLSKRMGILGELPPEQMLQKLDEEVANWSKADPTTPVQPALHVIVVTAQGHPSAGGKYRLRMRHKMIDEVLEIAKQRDAIVFLDVQVGHSTLQAELPELEKYLSLPNVHLGIDAEFAMKDGTIPGRKIGSFNAEDINYATSYLADLVTKNQIPPKMLIVHRFTQGMIKNTENIKLDPRYQVVMHMDGWGGPALKKDTYRRYIKNEPVQFTGFKLFYKNDTKNGHRLMTPEEVLALTPTPMYIQYQ
ncbi:hypothetical protein [Pontibacter pudoricolor]|uniref:hypothetical protein n=1 Tax=Pontibacter pudoricolor TaxID=2694930 RepID=UPI001EE4B56A|nr:hypothetical protein [Pontibacter pudoricolor]